MFYLVLAKYERRVFNSEFWIINAFLAWQDLLNKCRWPRIVANLLSFFPARNLSNTDKPECSTPSEIPKRVQHTTEKKRQKSNISLTLMLHVGFNLSQGKPRLFNYCYCNLLPLRFYFHAQKDRSTLSCHLSCQRCNCQEQGEVGSSVGVPQAIYRTTWHSLPKRGVIKICRWSDVPDILPK